MSSSTKGAVLITGCSDDGAGSALAAEFDAHGYRVFATSRSLKTMSKVENLPNVKTLELDITKTAQIRAAAETVAAETGGELTYLVNCAARNYFMPLLDQDIEDCKVVFETNVWGQLAVTQAFAPLLMKAKGTVVFITSLSGYLNVPYQGMLWFSFYIEFTLRFAGLYAASKRSEQIMAETLRLELAPFNVKVLSVVTGALKTMGQTHFEDWKLPAGSLYSPIEPTIKDRARGQEGAPRMEPCDYAKGVVNDIIRGRTGTIWHGASVGAVRFGTSWLPTWMMVSF